MPSTKELATRARSKSSHRPASQQDPSFGREGAHFERSWRPLLMPAESVCSWGRVGALELKRPHIPGEAWAPVRAVSAPVEEVTHPGRGPGCGTVRTVASRADRCLFSWIGRAAPRGRQFSQRHHHHESADRHQCNCGCHDLPTTLPRSRKILLAGNVSTEVVSAGSLPRLLIRHARRIFFGPNTHRRS